MFVYYNYYWFAFTGTYLQMFETFSEKVPGGTLHAAKERKGPKPYIWTSRSPKNAEPQEENTYHYVHLVSIPI